MNIRAKGIGLFFSGFAVGALAVTVLLWRTGVLRPAGVAASSARPPILVYSPRAVPTPLPDTLDAPAELVGAISGGEHLEQPRIGLPIAGLTAKDIQDTFHQLRGGTRPHEATDILAPRGTPVLAVEAGTVKKLFTSKPGGLTVYQFDPKGIYCYYYAHLDRYAEGLKEGMSLKRGDIIGYVGTTGNAPVNTPHLHFAIFRLGPEQHYWEGTPINPYPILIQALNQD